MKEMLTLKLDPKKATLDHIRRKLNLLKKDIDPAFGVVSIDPKQDLYAVLVEQEVAQKAAGVSGVQGPFSNPKIETFGPPNAKTAKGK